VHTHRNILNLLVRANPELLDGSLAGLARINQLRSYLVFDNKRAYFYSQLKKRKLPRGTVRSLHLQVKIVLYIMLCVLCCVVLLGGAGWVGWSGVGCMPAKILVPR
jgi:hypothetical protein